MPMLFCIISCLLLFRRSHPTLFHLSDDVISGAAISLFGSKVVLKVTLPCVSKDFAHPNASNLPFTSSGSLVVKTRRKA